MQHIPKILLTSGEPAGIGPELILQVAQYRFNAEIVVLADPLLLAHRAKLLKLPFHWQRYDDKEAVSLHQPGTIQLIPLTCPIVDCCGKPVTQNVPYVTEMLTFAAEKCLAHEFNAVVTAPVNKAIINTAGIKFQGHTEFFAEHANCKNVVMLLATQGLRVALVTTHLSLKEVPAAITKDHLRTVLEILIHDLKTKFSVTDPTIYVCGLNPHAGENGFLGREEIEIITPVLNEFINQGIKITGPLSADTIFSETNFAKIDVILAMYHDQGLPVLKYKSFGHAINITLGLPFIRTSVDHGTAFDIAGTGKADPNSLILAIEAAIDLGKNLKIKHNY